MPSSGPFAEWGRANTVTLQMLEKQINGGGGINGAKLRIAILDDATKPAQATNKLRKFAGDDKVLAVAGPLTSSAAEVTFPVANEMKIVATSQASSKPGVAKLNRPWAFRNTVDEGVLGRTTVPYYKKSFNIKICRDHLRRQGRNRGDRRQQDHAGVDEGERYRGAERQRSAVVQHRRSRRQCAGHQDEGAQSGRRRGQRGLQPGGHRHPRDEAAGHDQAGCRVDPTDIVGDPQGRAGNTDRCAGHLLRHHEEATSRRNSSANCNPCCARRAGLPPEIEPSMYDANIYEIVSIYIDAIKETGVTGKPEDLDADRTKIRDYMANLKGFEGFGGPIGFNDDGDAIKAFFIVQGQNGAWATKASACSAKAAADAAADGAPAATLVAACRRNGSLCSLTGSRPSFRRARPRKTQDRCSLQQLVNGLTLGAVYTLIALSFSLVMGILSILNLAIAELFMLGGYLGFTVISREAAAAGRAAGGHGRRGAGGRVVIEKIGYGRCAMRRR